jgi:6-phosphogluconolactonase
MDNGANESPCARIDSAAHGGRRLHALRILPTLAALMLASVIIGACGRSIYPKVSNSPTPTATITTSPTTGNFLYSSNFAAGQIARFTRSPAVGAIKFAGAGAAGSVNGPYALVNGPGAKFLYVTNSFDDNVQQFKINGSSGALTAIASPLATGKAPQGIAITTSAGFAYIANSGDGTISGYSVDAATGALTANGTFSSAFLKAPSGVVASDTSLYVTDQSLGTIVSFPINTDGTLAAGTATVLNTTSPATPGPVVLDPTGAFVYTTDKNLNLVYFLTVGATGLTLTGTYTSTSGGEGGLAITKTESGNGNEFLFVANQAANSISVFFVNTGGTLSIPAAVFADPSLDLPTGLVIDPTGTFLYLANQGNGTISWFQINPTLGTLGAGVPVAAGSNSSRPLFLAIGE